MRPPRRPPRRSPPPARGPPRDRRPPPGRGPRGRDRRSSPVNRRNTCPFLMRVFYDFEKHHAPSDFEDGLLPSKELRIYTWKDASFRELVRLIQQKVPEAKEECQLSLAFVFPDKRSRRGNVIVKPAARVHANKPGRDDDTKLDSLPFTIGDYLDVSIMSRAL